jgi:hypothetical protein
MLSSPFYEPGYHFDLLLHFQMKANLLWNIFLRWPLLDRIIRNIIHIIQPIQVQPTSYPTSGTSRFNPFCVVQTSKYLYLEKNW